VFFGENGLVLLQCTSAAGYRGRGKVTCARYEFEHYDVRYVDKRDLPGMPRERFAKVRE
jgi:hypothetical protein